MLAETLAPQKTWPALLWTGAGIFAVLLAQGLGLVFYLAEIRLTHSRPVSGSLHITQNASAVAAVTLLSASAIVLLLWGLTRIRTRSVAAYLALCWPSRRRFVVGALAFVVFVVTVSLLSRIVEPSADTNFVRDLVWSARRVGALPTLIYAAIAAGPISEELAFRGFLYRTLELKFGGIAAIIVTALGWAVLHIQYSAIGMAIIFAMGLFLGAMRRYSGSLYLTMLMHGLWNSLALVGAMLMTRAV